jgi:hypothetical protein
MVRLPVPPIALRPQQQIHRTAANPPCPSTEKEIFMQCKLATLFALFAALLAPAAHAQFGSGIVYDPTQRAHAIQQIEQASQLYTTAVATRNQIVTMCNLAHQMAQMPQNLAARYRADWSQWTSLQAPGNTYGNMSALVNALNYGALVNAQQGYTNAYVQAQNYPSGSYSSLDSRTQATVANQYATSELAQTTTTNTLATLGTIRSNSQAFSTKLSNLESDTFSTDSSQQTEAALLGKINSATLLQIHSQQDTNQLLMAQIQQQLTAQKQQIDAQNRAINNAIYFQQNFSNTMQNVTGGVSDSIHAISLSPTGR